MARTTRAHQYDTVDRICYRQFGRTAGITEQILELNPGLAEFGPVIPHGTLINLPDTPKQPQRKRTVQLWD